MRILIILIALLMGCTTAADRRAAMDGRVRCECPAICRTCLADTLAVWSYAEDERRRQAAKKLTEYEQLKARKR